MKYIISLKLKNKRKTLEIIKDITSFWQMILYIHNLANCRIGVDANFNYPLTMQNSKLRPRRLRKNFCLEFILIKEFLQVQLKDMRSSARLIIWQGLRENWRINILSVLHTVNFSIRSLKLGILYYIYVHRSFLYIVCSWWGERGINLLTLLVVAKKFSSSSVNQCFFTVGLDSVLYRTFYIELGRRVWDIFSSF